jgi:hypothetical protein
MLLFSHFATALSFSNRSLLTTTLSFCHQAKPRDLQFRGPFAEMFLTSVVEGFAVSGWGSPGRRREFFPARVYQS